MRITVDTNILIRAVVRDDAEQARRAERCLREATVIAVTLPCLCEFVWVLRRLYRFSPAEISAAIRALLAVAAIETNRPAVEAGLAMLDAGGDFADGVIAQQGAWLGGTTFLSFDQKAVTLLTAQGKRATVP